MKLIFLLFINLFYIFAVYGDGEHQSETIETKELNENDQNIVKLAQDKQQRQLIKKALWDSDQRLLKINQKSSKLNQKSLKLDQKLLKINQELNESFCMQVFGAMITIKIALEDVYYNASHSVVKSNEDNYKTLCRDTFQPKYIGTLINQDQKWIQTYDEKSRNKKNYYRDIQNYKQTWIKYLFSEEGHTLALLIAPKTLDDEARNSLFIRFSYNMARLYKIAYAACSIEFTIALEQNYKGKPQSFVENLKEVVPLWSCTAEQLKFFNKLHNYMCPNLKNLKALLFGIAKITETHNATFVVPYTPYR